MIKRISEIPFWGPEEQIRKFINQHDTTYTILDMSLDRLASQIEKLIDASSGTRKSRLQDILNYLNTHRVEYTTEDGKSGFWDDRFDNLARIMGWSDTDRNTWRTRCKVTQRIIEQQRIANLDDIFQKQLIWSYGRQNVDDAYFYWDWCPVEDDASDNKWQYVEWDESKYNLFRKVVRTFKYDEFQGWMNSRSADQMVRKYDSRLDVHSKEGSDEYNPVDLDIDVLRHNIMCSYLEVSEWLGDGAVQYGSHNGFVSRKMSLAWLFNAIRALINWKLANQEKWTEADIHPLECGSWNAATKTWTYEQDDDGNFICERFLNLGESSTQGLTSQAGRPDEPYYSDPQDLTNASECRLAVQRKQRAKEPWKNGVLKVRGNEFHYGERADFYTHNSFIGECRFFHNARFLGQTTFDKEINGTAMRSRWADLAEYKEADKQYEPGTLVMFGGEKEITLARKGKANAIVTTRPGLALNGDDHPGKIMVGIALTGTVPVKVVGTVGKFDKLVADAKYPGYARRRRWYEFWKRPIAIALENWSAGGIISCMTKMEF